MNSRLLPLVLHGTAAFAMAPTIDFSVLLFACLFII